MSQLIQLVQSVTLKDDLPVFTPFSYYLIEGGADITIIKFLVERDENSPDISDDVISGLRAQGLRTLRKKRGFVHDGLQDVLVRFDSKSGLLDFQDPNVFGQVDIHPLHPHGYPSNRFKHLFWSEIGFRNQAEKDYPQLRSLSILDEIRFYCLQPKSLVAELDYQKLSNLAKRAFPVEYPVGKIIVGFETYLLEGTLSMATDCGHAMSLSPVQKPSHISKVDEPFYRRTIKFVSAAGEYNVDGDWCENAWVSLDIGEGYEAGGKHITTKRADLVYIAREGFDYRLFELFQKIAGGLALTGVELKASKYQRDNLKDYGSNAAVVIAKGSPISTPEDRLRYELIKMAARRQ